MNTIIKIFQIIHLYIYEHVVLHHHIIVPLQPLDQIFQNGTLFWILVMIFQWWMLHTYNHQNNFIIFFLLPFTKLNFIYFKRYLKFQYRDLNHLNIRIFVIDMIIKFYKYKKGRTIVKHFYILMRLHSHYIKTVISSGSCQNYWFNGIGGRP